ncbi:peptide deformylase [bacterium]|nr:peptide deformylase [bacterium]MBU1613715.1 peptide deformylase [bacterium]
MAILPIKEYPNSVLRKRAKEVGRIRKRTLNLITNMIETMCAEGGVGLAANQVGALQRIIVVDTGTSYDPRHRPNEKERSKENLTVLVNPEILSYQGEETAEEGCLSLPEITGKVTRAAFLKVRGLNQKGEALEMEYTGLSARIFQHEIDHLNGVLFIDRMEREEEQ